jgi:hypothetical protein
MVTVLEEYTIEEQRFVERFLWAKEPNDKNLHNKMFPVYGGKCFSRKAVHTSRPKLRPNKPIIQWVHGAVSTGIKRQGCETEHSPPSSA